MRWLIAGVVRGLVVLTVAVGLGATLLLVAGCGGATVQSEGRYKLCGSSSNSRPCPPPESFNPLTGPS